MYLIATPDWHILASNFKTRRGAMISFSRKYYKTHPTAKIMSNEEFNKNEPMVETTNILSGKKLMIRASEKGGCCDPGTERYHCM